MVTIKPTRHSQADALHRVQTVKTQHLIVLPAKIPISYIQAPANLASETASAALTPVLVQAVNQAIF